jgi:biopolymer transport protein ExbD
MAFSFNGGQSRHRFRGVSAMSEMNVVPLVDVVLVLLVIFMLTAHVMEFGLEVEVPKVRQVANTTEELPVVSITRSGELYLNEKPVNINALATEIQQSFGTSETAYVRADKATTWDPIAQVISVLAEAKIDVRMVTQPEDEAESQRR